MDNFIPEKEILKKEVYSSFKKELLKKRQPQQAEELLKKAKLKDHLVKKLVDELIKRNLYFRIQDYVSAQFFSLNYMPYLPKIEHITSLKGFERWEKVKGYYKYINAKINYEKVNKRRKKRIFSDEELLSFKKIISYEEEDKKLYLNVPIGFDLCLSNEIFFNPVSKYCRKCIYKVYCKNILKKNCLPLFQYRCNIIGETKYLSKMRNY